MIDIIISVIIYLAAFALLTRGLIRRRMKVDRGNVNAEPGTPVPDEKIPASDGKETDAAEKEERGEEKK